MRNEIILKTIASLRTQVRESETSTRRFSQKATALRRELDGELRNKAVGASDSARETRLKNRVQTNLDKRMRASEKVQSLGKTLGERLRELSSNTPQELVTSMSDGTPIVLLPMKLETRFFNLSTDPSLRIRLFPDPISIAGLRRGLANEEAAAGKVFWQELSKARQIEGSQQRREAEEGAALALAAHSEPNRANWIALSLRPQNWPQNDDAIPPKPDDLVFPEAENDEHPLPPRANLLPDRFVVTLYRNNSKQHEVTGAAVLADLAIGPEPDGASAAISRDEVSGQIKVADSLNWLFDYDAAVRAGMAVTVRMTERQARAGFDRVVALGVRYSETAESSRQRLEEHFKELQYSTGIDVVRQGTPTNNTETVKSGHTTSGDATAQAFLKSLRRRQPELQKQRKDKTDAQRFSTALGIDFSGPASWDNGDSQDIAEALAMNRALWPATLGGFMKNYLSPVAGGSLSATVDDRLIENISRFALDFVTGRGLLPAIKVGDQPYGMLVTSDLRSYNLNEAGLGRRTPLFPGQLKPVMDRFTELFQGFDERLKSLARPGDPSDIMSNILGLHASSVSFRSRKGVSDAVSWNNLLFQGIPAEFRATWFAHFHAFRLAALKRLGLSEGDREIGELVFLGATDELTGPVVDGDSEIPLSETEGIRSFRSEQNYVHWLINETETNIRNQRFVNDANQRVPRPAALLYQYLRHGWLAQLGEQSTRVAVDLAADKFSQVRTQAKLIGIDSPANAITLPDDAASALKPAELGIDVREPTLGELILGNSRLPPDRVPELKPPVVKAATSMRELRASLETLAPLPTARLERLFAEHMDLCMYRLDAWHSALFSSRLQAMRAQADHGTGIFLGAYALVENLRPRAPATPVDPNQIPEPLRPSNGSGVVERPDNGGYVHAPSQAHAVTAAILRNAYLTHADRENSERFAINLDSSRVRKAMRLIEGLRENQPLGALLGYRFERGLHEQHPDLELDRHIYTLRARFPLTSKRLVDVPDDESAEVIEARNVVDGYDLMEHASANAYPWGVSGLPGTDSSEARAILEEIDELQEMFDAMSDLMMAESVHQAVNGSTERARGALQSITDGEVPPVPEVAQTPRSGQVITQRVIAHLPQAEHWPTRTERSKANARLNGWLVQRLPDPRNIAISVRLESQDIEFLRLSDSGIDALDVVLMAGANPGSGATELERWLVDRYSAENSLNSAIAVLHRDANSTHTTGLAVNVGEAPDGAVSLDAITPLLLSLQKLVTASRPATAEDYRLPTESDLVSRRNPKGIVTTGNEVSGKNRLEAAFATLQGLVQSLGSIVDDPTVQAAYTALLNDSSSYEAGFWSAHITSLRTGLREVYLYGHSQALPVSATGESAGNAQRLYEQAVELKNAMTRHLGAAETALQPITDDVSDDKKAQVIGQRLQALRDAGRALFTRNFTFVPSFRLDEQQQSEIGAGIDSPIVKDPMRLERWLQGLVRVRDRMADLTKVRDWGEWTGAQAINMTPVQLPRRESDTWIGEGITAAVDDPERMSVMLLDAQEPGSSMSALLLDTFSETVPTNTEISGLSFHYDRPNAEAPQAILLAVPPVVNGNWTWDALLDTINDTFDRARLRAVEPDFINGTDWFHALPANLVPFSQGSHLSTLLMTNVNSELLDTLQNQ